MSSQSVTFGAGFGGPAPAAEPAEPVAPDEVAFSQAAAHKVTQLVAANGRQHQLLRVFIEGGGCSGFQYGFEFEDEVAEDDIVVERDGVKLLVDPMSVHYLGGARVDYLEDLAGARFVVSNPNASTTCGCGSSFSV